MLKIYEQLHGATPLLTITNKPANRFGNILDSPITSEKSIHFLIKHQTWYLIYAILNLPIISAQRIKQI